jgi:hypothetical protein
MTKRATNPHSKEQIELFLTAERAKISRSIRETEAGWIFYDERGSAWHITCGEAARLEQEANVMARRQAMRMERRLNWSVGLMCVGLIPYLFAIVFLLPDWLGWTVPYLVIIYIFALIAVVIMFAVDYRLRRLVWQHRLGRKFRVLGRGGVPREVAIRHRHYNLFRIVCFGSVTLLLLRFAWIAFVTKPEGPGGMSLFDFALVMTATLTSFPAMKIDDVHIRRKWFD